MNNSLPAAHSKRLAVALSFIGLMGLAAPFSSRLLQAAEPAALVLKEIAKIQNPLLDEASGLVKSRVHADVFWTITDSGTRPVLYAINSNGMVLKSYRVAGAVNLDWEALAIDDAGNLYLGDVGNSIPFVSLPRRWVYRIQEPNPLKPLKKSEPPRNDDPLPAVKISATYVFSFPARPFDIEGMFWHKGDLYLTSKVSRGDAKLYRLPLEDKPIDEKKAGNKLVLVGSLPSSRRVTGAALSPNGRKLALCSYKYVTILDVKNNCLLTLLADQKPQVCRFKNTSIESCAWDHDRLVLVGENRSVYQITFAAGSITEKNAATKPIR